MNLSDSRQEPAPGYLFPLAVCAPVGLPGSSTDLSTRAAPFHPEQPGDCSYPLLHRRFQASSSSADWPLLSCVTRPIRVCFYNCGSRVRLTRLRQQNYSRPRLLGYLSNGQLTRYPPFRILDRPGLSWRSEEHEAHEGLEGLEGFGDSLLKTLRAAHSNGQSRGSLRQTRRQNSLCSLRSLRLNILSFVFFVSFVVKSFFTSGLRLCRAGALW
jgi:hypothetical protein